MDTMGYESGKIYKIVCQDGNYYIGSTLRTLKSRLASHKHASKHTDTNNAYNHINTIGWDNVTIQLIELFPCKTKQELLERELWHIAQDNTNNCLNTRNPVVSEKAKEVHREKCKEYYQEHRDEILKKRSEYQIKNREKRTEYNRLYVSENANKLKDYNQQYVAEHRERRNQLARERRATKNSSAQ